MGVLGHDDMLVVQVERDIEAATQLREVLQGATKEGNVSADGVTTGKAGDRLVCDGLENGRRNIGGRRALVQQGLDIGFCKHAAARRYRVNLLCILGKVVQTGSIGFEQRCHLVDKRTGTAGACTIHALLDAVVKVDNLCVLTTKLNSYIGLGDKSLNRAL